MITLRNKNISRQYNVINNMWNMIIMIIQKHMVIWH